MAVLGRVVSEPLAQPLPDVPMRLGRLRRRGGSAGADRPHRLVGDYQQCELLARQPIEPCLDLTIEYAERLAALALIERLADADDGREARRECGDRFSIDHRVGLAEQCAALGVSDDHILGAGLADHRRADLSGECALALPVGVLRRNHDVAVAGRLRSGVQRGERRREHDLDVGDVLHQAAELFDVLHGLVDRLVHLPVSRDEWSAHAQSCKMRNSKCKRFKMPVCVLHLAFCIFDYAWGSTATPGSVRPPRNSSDAPPPVEMCVMRSVTPAFFTAAIESPPPMMVVPLTSATAFATAIVPRAKSSISNTPIGPFHTSVFASRTAAAYALIVSGPMSS